MSSKLLDTAIKNKKLKVTTTVETEEYGGNSHKIADA
jgi:hypothetical protein